MTQVPHSTADGDPPPATSTPNDMPASPASPWSDMPWAAIHSATTSESAQQFILYEIVQQLTRELDPDIIIQKAVNTIMQLNRWQSIGISLRTSDAQHWQTRAENRMAPGEVGTYHEINTGVIGRAYRTGTIQLVPDVHSDPDFFLAEGVTHIHSELAIPISFDGHVLGVMNLESDQRAAFDQSDITFAQSISNILALALKNAQRFTAIQQEISERAQSEARFTTTFHHSPVAMVITRLDDNMMIETNNAWLDLLEYSREEIIGYAALSIGIWANPQDRHYLISSLQIHHRITDFETMIYAKSGRMLYVLVSAEQTMIVNDMCMLFQVTDITARKQAEIAQRASEEKYRGLIRSLDSIIAAVDDKSRFLYLNDVAAALFNNTPDRLVGKTIYDVFPESATLSYLEQRIRKVIHEDCGQVAEYQSQFLGKARWYRISMQPIHDEHGNVAYVLINATDIHDLKTAQQELLELTHTLEDRVKERTAEVQDLYENSPNGYHSLDTSGIITMVNQTELTWLGYTREEMLGQPFIDFITEPSRRTFFDNYMIFKQRGWVRDIEYELTRKDGTTFPILLNATAIYDDAGNFVMSRSTAFDNTERKKAEDALRDSQANLQNFLDTASDLIQSLDSRGNIQYVNNAWCETLGYTADEALQLSVFHVIDPAYHDHCRMVLNNLMLSKQSQQMEVIFRTKHGRAVVVEGSVSGRQHNDGQCSTNGIFRDITRRKQAEETLRIAHAEMERALRTKDEFLANMSHELRTPLNAILTLSESLLEEVRGPLSARQQESVQHIEESGRHLLALINDILDLSKVEAGRLDLQIEVVSVADVCRSSLQFVKEIAIKKQIQLGFHLSDELAEMEVDPRRLKQMLVNLLSNAVKFTPAGGQVSLDVSIQPGEEVVSFAVRDTGIGIPPEGMQRLFRPFTQLDSSLNRQHEGTGLGLALVRRLTDLHGGSIMVESEIDKGSSFTIALPYHTSGHSTVMLAEPALFHTRNLHSALVVEDSPNIVEQITRYLQEISIHTVVHAQGSDAIHLATTMQPGIIFLDLMMPDQSGWEILAKLKTDRQTQDIPVVIISVMDDRLRGLAAGASEYLIKPISRETLHQALYTVTHTIADDPLVTIPPPPKAPPIGARILLAEDNEVNLQAVRDYLEEKGYMVTVARTGREALEQAKEVVPDLILMDIQMPEMDGLEAIQHLRDRAESAATPIIALTALAMAGDRERCLAAGASEYLTKPVSLRGLVETMHRLLPK